MARPVLISQEQEHHPDRSLARKSRIRMSPIFCRCVIYQLCCCVGASGKAREIFEIICIEILQLCMRTKRNSSFVFLEISLRILQKNICIAYIFFIKVVQSEIQILNF